MKTFTLKRKDGLTLKAKMLDTLDECATSAGNGDIVKGQSRLVDFLQKYAAQKDIFPEAFDDIVEAIASEAKFSRASTIETITNPDGTTKNVTVYIDPHATEGDYIKDFRKVVSQLGNSALNLAPDATGTVVSKWLQAVLNRKTYEMDLARSTRERKTKIDEVFVRGARGGIVDKIGDERDRWIAKWKGNFEKLGVDFDDFETDDVEQNVERLAMALYKFTLAKSAQQFS